MTGKELLNLIEARLLDDSSPEDYFLEEGEGPLDAWKEYPMLYLAYGSDREGCVRESGPFGDPENLEQEIIHQAHTIFGALRDQAVKAVGRTDTHNIQVWTEPSYEDTAHTVVLDDKHNVVLLHYYDKPWHFCWDTPDEMGKQLEGWHAEMVTRLRQAPAMAAGPELLAALQTIIERLEAWQHGEQQAQFACEEQLDRLAAEGHWNTIKNYRFVIDQARAVIAKVERGPA